MRPASPDPTTFNPLLWTIVRQITPGRVATYGQIASMLPLPSGVSPEDFARLGPRWVGDAMNAVSTVDAPDIPWHRVINSRGGISLPPDSRAGVQQRERLEAEGVLFNARGVCELNRFGWEGPDDAFLTEHGLAAPRPVKKPADDGGQLPLF